jgi:hypothetical protein
LSIDLNLFLYPYLLKNLNYFVKFLATRKAKTTNFSPSFVVVVVVVGSKMGKKSGSGTRDKHSGSATSVADRGCLSRIQDPDLYPFRIQDPKTATKERGEKKFVV